MKTENLLGKLRSNVASSRFFLGALFVSLCCLGVSSAQTRDLTVDVLVNSTNAIGYSTNAATPGEFQRYPERYLEHLQIPYRVIDVSRTAPPDMTLVPLVIAGHRGLNLSAAWQGAIQSAVSAGTGFVNLDWDANIGSNSHIQAIFGATGSSIGTPATSISLPATFLPDGATPHYITALQVRLPSTPAGDLVYTFHSDDNDVQSTATSTLLLNAHGTVLAKLGNDPLLTVTTLGAGRAVNFGTYDYLRADRFGFVMGLDDLFWRSLVWAARKPFVLRGYPRLFAVQQDDPVAGWDARVGDLSNPSFTGNVQPDGTGGPWKVTGMVQNDDLDPGSVERQNIISFINSGRLKVSPHTVTGSSGGDLYWTGETPNPLTDSQWLANYNALKAFQQGQGGADVLPFSSSIVPHFWDLSNNVGQDIWDLGIRYITAIQKPGVYFEQAGGKTDAQRLKLHPFRIYELPPTYGNPNERWPIFYADDYTVGSRAGQSPKTFFGFATQLLGFTYPSFDAVWPNDPAGYSLGLSLENWQAYTWRFWSSMAPAQVYTHDGGNMEHSTDQERQQMVSQLSTWLGARGVRHTYMEDFGAYLRARTKSTLTTGTVTPSTITLNFTGSATDMNGALVTTKTYVFYGDNEGTLVDVPGFTNGRTLSFANVAPPGLALSKTSLNFSSVPGSGNPPSQTISVSNSGSGTLNWTVSDNATWLTVTPASGTNAGTLTASVNVSGLTPGTYTATITVSANGATNSPQGIAVTLVISSPSLGLSPTSLSLNGFQGQPNPSPAPITISNLGGGILNWSAASDAPWLTLSSGAGTAPSVTNAQANISGLAIGTYNANITVNSPGSSNAPQVVPVTLGVSGLLMTSDFNDGTMQGWVNSPLGRSANWSVIGGVLQNNGGGHTQVYAGDSAWTDYDLFVDIKLASLSDYPGGIRGRVNPVSGAAYTLWLYPNEKIVRLYRTVGWNIDSGFALLGQASVTFDATSFHNYRLSFKGQLIQVYVDGTPVIAASDPTYTNGLVALDVSNQVINFDNVVVSGSVGSSDTVHSAPTSFSFAGPAGGVNPAAQSLLISSSGGTLAWTAASSVPWLTLSATSGNSGSSTNVTPNVAGLASGTYNGTITITARGAQNSPITVPVTLVLAGQAVLLSSTPSALNFMGATTLNPVAQGISLSSSPGAVNFTVGSDSTWLSGTPTTGTTAASVTVSATSVGSAVGTFNGNLVLSSGQATNAPVSVPVTLTVGNLLFSDDFSSGTASNWLISPMGLAANWSVVNNAYLYNGGGATQAYTGSQTWTDYSFSTDVKLATTSNYPGGIRARLNLTTGAGYGVWFYPGSGLIKLFAIGQWNIDSGSLSLVAQAPLTFDTNVHNVRIDMKGPTITVFYDNKQVIQATDTTFTSGGIALDVSNQAVQYDNVRVISF